MRPSARTTAELRPIRITRQFTKHAEGAVLVEFGDTRVICTAWGHPSDLHRQRRGASTAVSQGQGTGLGNRRIRHVASRHQHPDGSRG